MNRFRSLVTTLLGVAALVVSVSGCTGTMALPSPVSPLTTPTATPEPTPDWPQCRELPVTMAFMRGGNLWLLDGRTDEERPLTFDPGHGKSGVAAPSPDGRRIAYTQWTTEKEWEIKVVFAETSETRVLEESFWPRYPSVVSWADPSHVVYDVFLDEDGDAAKLHSNVTVDLTRGTHRVLVTDTFHYRSHDGRYDLRGHWDPRGGQEPGSSPYVLLDRETGEERTVLEGEAWFQGWSPDSRLMLFRLNLEPINWPARVVVIDAETGEEWAISGDGRLAEWSTWSPDGSSIAFFESRPESFQILLQDANLWVSDPTGEDRRALLEGEDGSGFLEHLLGAGPLYWTPDGSRLIFLGHLYGADGNTYWSIQADGSGLCRLGDYDWLQPIGPSTTL